jgi:hypothetical protein
MEITWPQKGDKAFLEGPSACYMGTRWGGPQELGMIAAGYKAASDLLVDHLEKHCGTTRSCILSCRISPVPGTAH